MHSMPDENMILTDSSPNITKYRAEGPAHWPGLADSGLTRPQSTTWEASQLQQQQQHLSRQIILSK